MSRCGGASCCREVRAWHSRSGSPAAASVTRRGRARRRPRRRRRSVAKPDGDLVYFNWSEYLDPKLIKDFEKRYGVKVRESNFDSMNGMMAKLRSGNRYDVIFPTADWAQRLIKGNQLLRFDKAQLKNSDDGLRLLRQAVVRPGRRPHGALRALRVGDHLPQGQDRADRLLERPRRSTRRRAASTCSTTTRRCSARARWPPASDLNTKDQAEVDKAKQWALDLKPKLRGFSTDDIQNMVGGNAWIHHGWNGDVVNVRNQVKKPENYSFQKCAEGIPLGTDCMAIPANAEHPGTALTFINFILEPENAARNIEYMGYPMPYTGPDETFAELVKTDPSINVTIEDLENGEQFRDLGADGRRMWDEAWTEIKAA